MDREALKRQAASRRNHVEIVEAPVKKKITWKCDHCDHEFIHERVFMNHICKERIRHDEVRTVIGQAAYSFYNLWMKLNKRSSQSLETFSGSGSYTTFIKFATWAKRVRLPDPERYIKSMVEHGNVSPSLWTRDNVYAMYLQGYDGIVTPDEQFLKSLDEILSLVSELKVEPGKVFDVVGIDTLVLLVHKRKISPWFLIASSAFRAWWQGLPADDASRIEDTLQIGALMIRISSSEELKASFAEFTKATKELGL